MHAVHAGLREWRVPSWAFNVAWQLSHLLAEQRPAEQDNVNATKHVTLQDLEDERSEDEATVTLRTIDDHEAR